MKKTYFALMVSALSLLCPFAGYSQTFTSVDLNPGADDSDPGGFVSFHNKIYFYASDDTHGTELWVSDGTPAGTMLLKDIWPGLGSSNPSNLTVFNGSLYFNASDSLHGEELWISDGTGSGTTLLKDIRPGTRGSNPGATGGFIQLGAVLLFNASDSAHGAELWKTDGTAGGTVLVNDINTGPQSGSPGGMGGFVVCNGKVYFSAYTSAYGTELWVTDGTTGGTVMVADIYPGPSSSDAGSTSTGGQGFYSLNNTVYFAAADSATGIELWKTDGTTNGTQMVADILPGSGNSYPGYFSGMAVYGNKLYFSASDGTHGYELWVSDGTGGGTIMVKDIYPGSGSSYPNQFLPYAGKLYFDAHDTLNDRQLYATDGTSLGTVAVSDINSSGAAGFSPNYPVVFNNLLYMIGNDSATGSQLFVNNGTDTGFTLLAPPIVTNSSPLAGVTVLFPFDHSLVFAGDYTSIGNELWFYTLPIISGIAAVDAAMGITAYPNPFADAITLQGLRSGTTYTVSLTDVSGRLIEQHELQGSMGNAILNTRQLTAGIYLLQIHSGSTTQTLKIVKE